MKWIELNNELKVMNDGKFQFEKDKEAVKEYFLQYVNVNTVFFHDLKEKIKYLLENEYYDDELFEKYTFEQVKEIFKLVYDKKFRFSSFMSAFKFYNNYSLKTDDGSKFLERYEDRVAVNALYLADGDFEKAKNQANIIIEQCYQPSTPTFLNAGRKRSGDLVSCFLIDCPDTTEGIIYTIGSSAQLSRRGGGVGINLSKIRANNEPIKGVEGAASGVIGVAKLLEDTFSHFNQLNQRAGSGVAYLNIFHADIESFLETKKVNVDEKIRLKTLSIGVIAPSKFFELAEKDAPYFVFYPYSVYKEYGQHLDEMNMDEWYDKLINNKNIRKKKLDARKMLTKIAQIQQESGYPYFMFKDNANKANPLKDIGQIKMSNLCVTGDTMLLTDEGYFTVKDLYERKGSLNVVIDNRTVSNEESGTRVVSALPMQKTAENADVFKIMTKQGHEIKATKWHKFFVKRNNEIVKIPLSEIKVGDNLLVQSGEGAYGEFDDKELAYLLGLIVADGTITDVTAKIYLYGKKQIYKGKIEQYVATVIERYLDREVKYNASLNPHFTTMSQQDGLSMSSQLLLYVLNKIFNINKENVKLNIPKIMFTATKETQASFLSGLYQMDGTVNALEKYKAMSFEIVQINRSFLVDLQKMILNMGIYSTLYLGRKAGKTLLPDSNRELKEYDCKQCYKLSIQDRNSRDAFCSIVEMKKEDIDKVIAFNSILQPKSRKPKHNYLATVMLIEYVGKEDVYDTTQKDYHSLIFNGIVTGNCNEIYQIQKLSDIQGYQGQDGFGYDISCNLGSLNITNVMDKGLFKESVKTAMDALNVVAKKTSMDSVPTVKNGNDLFRSVGLGVMNLHGYLAKNKIMYHSEEAKDFVNTFFAMMNFYSIQRSMEIAKEENFNFHGFENSEYAKGTYFDKYIHNSYEPKLDKVKKLFEEMHIPNQKDWEELMINVQKNGLAHSFRMACAPTGNISYIQNATASVMPITEQIETRTYGDSTTHYPMPYMTNENFFYYQPAYEMDMFKVIDLISVIQEHVDQGISTIMFVDSNKSTRDLARYYIYAHKKGLKGLYYTRTKLLTVDECIACSV